MMHRGWVSFKFWYCKEIMCDLVELAIVVVLQLAYHIISCSFYLR